MKFAEHLFTNSAPEWRKQYIQYQSLKALLYEGQSRIPTSWSNIINGDFNNNTIALDLCQEHFFDVCQKELEKINAFYSEKLVEAKEKFLQLQSDLETILLSRSSRFIPTTYNVFPSNLQHYHNKQTTIQMTEEKDRPPGQQKWGHQKRPLKKIRNLRLGFTEFYLSLVILKNYQKLNYTGFSKICKKHDKLFSSSMGSSFFIENIPGAEFHTSREVDFLISSTEQLVTDKLETGNRPRAMKRLRVPPRDGLQKCWTTFKLGLFTGILVVLFIILLMAGFLGWAESTNWSLILRLYRAPLLLIGYVFLMGVNVFVWRSTGVNHVLIFELDPRDYLTEQHLMLFATFFGVSTVLSVLYAVLMDNRTTFTPYMNSLALLILMFLFMINPLNVFSRHSRFWVMSTLGRIVSAPFFQVKFADFWLADQLNSLAQVLLDAHYNVCLYATSHGDFSGDEDDAGVCRTVGSSSIWIRAVLSCLPALFRLLQCLRRYRDSKEAFPHLANAAKYSTTLCVVLISTLHLIYEGSSTGPLGFLWISSMFVSTIYSLFWDLRMDWGLFEKEEKSGKTTFLRKERVYSYPIVYYIATVQNIILRFSWTLSYGLVGVQLIRKDSMVSVVAGLEVYRRFVWNFFRLENEHVNNCGKFRAVRDISLAHLSHTGHIYSKRQSAESVP